MLGSKVEHDERSGIPLQISSVWRLILEVGLGGAEVEGGVEDWGMEVCTSCRIAGS